VKSRRLRWVGHVALIRKVAIIMSISLAVDSPWYQSQQLHTILSQFCSYRIFTHYFLSMCLNIILPYPWVFEITTFKNFPTKIGYSFFFCLYEINSGRRAKLSTRASIEFRTEGCMELYDEVLRHRGNSTFYCFRFMWIFTRRTPEVRLCVHWNKTF
jgi:hypothetical protein